LVQAVPTETRLAVKSPKNNTITIEADTWRASRFLKAREEEIGQEWRRLHEVINRVRRAGGKLFQGVPERRAQ
jgi:hypothetical protein